MPSPSESPRTKHDFRLTRDSFIYIGDADWPVVFGALLHVLRRVLLASALAAAPATAIWTLSGEGKQVYLLGAPTEQKPPRVPSVLVGPALQPGHTGEGVGVPLLPCRLLGRGGDAEPLQQFQPEPHLRVDLTD